MDDTSKTILAPEYLPGQRVEFTDILWDNEDSDDDEEGEGTADLPENVVMTLPADWTVDDDLADLLSDEYGYCVLGYNANATA